jgi:methylated-DNA-protein-cysteine methyltransferase-like protein
MTFENRTFEDRVVAVVSGLASGEVVTYGEVAREAGAPGAARAVGNILAKVGGLPWWRVVLASGRLAAANPVEQAGRLKAEGVVVCDGRIVGWRR